MRRRMAELNEREEANSTKKRCRRDMNSSFTKRLLSVCLSVVFLTTLSHRRQGHTRVVQAFASNKINIKICRRSTTSTLSHFHRRHDYYNYDDRQYTILWSYSGVNAAKRNHHEDTPTRLRDGFRGGIVSRSFRSSSTRSINSRLNLFSDPSSRKGQRIVNGDQSASFTYQTPPNNNKPTTTTNNHMMNKNMTGTNKNITSSSTATAATSSNIGTNTVLRAPLITSMSGDNVIVEDGFLNGTTILSEPEGIGGLGGIVYDVNKLKRNLLQETLKAYKRELWTLLESPTTTEEEIVDKLGALVQASAVRTTTDSNLLDGTWTLAYTSKYGTIADLKRPPVPLAIRNKNRNRQRQQQRSAGASSSVASMSSSSSSSTPISRRVGGKESFLTTRQWTFCLEHLDDDESAYCVQDMRLLGSALVRKTVSVVTGLTRNSLSIARTSRDWYVFGQKIRTSSNESITQPRASNKQQQQEEQQLNVAYLDVDLAIVSDSPYGAAPSDSTNFYVYTKNQAWMDPKARTRRKIRNILEKIEYFVLRRRRNAVKQSRLWRSPQEEVDRILQEIEADTSKLRVLRLGEYVKLSSNPDADDESWASDVDPFVHLTADERQAKIKSMSVRQIENAGYQKQSKTKRERTFGFLIPRLFRRRRKTFFKRPEDIE